LLNKNHQGLVRLYIPHSFNADAAYALPEGQAHYLRTVMRKSAGDLLRVFNGKDGEWIVELKEISKKNVIVEFSKKILEQKSSPDIWVLASPVKKEAMELMVEKACELGAAKFIPVLCEHTVVRQVNQKRLQAIAVEAAEQSERMDVMVVEPVVALKKLLSSSSWDRNLIFCIERMEARSLRDAMPELQGKPLALLIGPEGGFSQQEVTFISGFGGVYPVSLGSRILRAETAMITALAGVNLFS
jgi:16S rRNA (uracil1498-N3)-methyltransferase